MRVSAICRLVCEAMGRAQGDDRVEAAVTEQAIHLRDFKDVQRPPFTVGREGWTRFVGFVTEV
ncbi:DUF397 domain-containing protein [Streptomyces sp. NPDC059454]|uniref:DUF397 domain-containing protein n=1 Tax=Streptomyces sp. NPDC059454 TaxID=3346836 RepID=UPI00369D2542